MGWPNLARLNLSARKRNERFEQYLETEQHDWMDVIETIAAAIGL